MPQASVEIRLDIPSAYLVRTLVVTRLLQLDESDRVGTSPGWNIRASYERTLHELNRVLPDEVVVPQ